MMVAVNQFHNPININIYIEIETTKNRKDGASREEKEENHSSGCREQACNACTCRTALNCRTAMDLDAMIDFLKTSI
uniref:Uncharacterized protein n=1 Tax=Onchocerca volvulus TaxID=6282 RepID=A0A8R1TQU9_ONCVO